MEKLTPNELAFIALANEYCHAMECAHECESRDQFVAQMLKLLPRLYITVGDIEDDSYSEEFIDSALEEDVYDLVRERVAMIMAEEDIYLEVFMEDMKYSESPILSTISENLADIYQELKNFVMAYKNATNEGLMMNALAEVKDEFQFSWGQKLVNVQRALHEVRYSEEDEY